MPLSSQQTEYAWLQEEAPEQVASPESLTTQEVTKYSSHEIDDLAREFLGVYLIVMRFYRRYSTFLEKQEESLSAPGLMSKALSAETLRQTKKLPLALGIALSITLILIILDLLSPLFFSRYSLANLLLNIALGLFVLASSLLISVYNRHHKRKIPKD